MKNFTESVTLETLPKAFSQLQIIFQYLQENIATVSMVAEATGIYEKNICRYKRLLEKAGLLWKLEKKTCKKTGFKAWYLSSNPEYVSNHVGKQLPLF